MSVHREHVKHEQLYTANYVQMLCYVLAIYAVKKSVRLYTGVQDAAGK